jgi:hypothetical protein
MKKILITLSILLLFIMPVASVQASEDVSAGIKPGNIFYFLDITFEKVGLFLAFSPEKKAQKALVYAEERLAEAEKSASKNKPKAVEKAMADYEKKILLATEKSKKLKDEKKAEELLTSILNKTLKHQDILREVRDNVPDEAKEAIDRAIEVSSRGYDQA